MMRMAGLGVALVASLSIAAGAADRVWQRGTWVEVRIERPRFVFGVQPRQTGPVPQQPTMTVIRTYVLDTEDWRIELKEPVPPPRRSVEAVVGDPVIFALEKNTVYVRAEDGREQRLRVMKKQERRRER